MTLSRLVNHYGPRSDFPYYNMTTPIECAPLSIIQGHAEQVCVFVIQGHAEQVCVFVIQGHAEQVCVFVIQGHAEQVCVFEPLEYSTVPGVVHQ